MWVEFWVLGCRFRGTVFRVKGAGFRVQGFILREANRLRVKGPGFRDQDFWRCELYM